MNNMQILPPLSPGLLMLPPPSRSGLSLLCAAVLLHLLPKPVTTTTSVNASYKPVHSFCRGDQGVPGCRIAFLIFCQSVGRWSYNNNRFSTFRSIFPQHQPRLPPRNISMILDTPRSLHVRYTFPTRQRGPACLLR